MTKDSRLRWLVDNRSRIQELLLSLYERAPASWDGHDEFAGRYQFLVGAGFSLWRAVFLIDEERKAPTVANDAAQFLRILIADNAINYVQEDKTRKWSGGYYVNNAF